MGGLIVRWDELSLAAYYEEQLSVVDVKGDIFFFSGYYMGVFFCMLFCGTKVFVRS